MKSVKSQSLSVLLLLFLSLLTLPSLATVEPGPGNILYVNQQVDQLGEDYVRNGSSWANALPELADALLWARQQYDADPTVFDSTPLKIYVAKGTYRPLYHAADEEYDRDGDRDNAFVLVRNVQLYGGFDPENGITELTHTRLLPVLGDATGGSTVLSGDLDENDDPNGTIKGENAYHVVISAGDVGTARLDGFTITGGQADGSEYITVNERVWIFQRNGGGMYNYDSSPVLTNVTISSNTASGSGGGMSNQGSSAVLTNVTISGNTASGNGGGMYNEHSVPVLTNVTISGNTTFGNGGGMFNNLYSNPVLTNSIVWGNGVGDPIAGFQLGASSSNLIEGGHDSNIPGDFSGLTLTDIFTDPNNPTTPDYTLKAGSPAINAGNNTAYTDAGGNLDYDLDLSGNSRLAGATIDLGAYESPYEDITVLSDPPAAITFDYGPKLTDIPLPSDFTMTATLTNGNTEVVELDHNTAHWVTTLPTGDSNDPLTVGTYTFEVPILLPAESDPDWFTNSKNLVANLTVTVTKNTPILTANWDGVEIDIEEGLELTYGDIAELVLSHDNTDVSANPSISFIDGDEVLDLTDLAAVAAVLSGTGRLMVTLAETDNFFEKTIEFEVRSAQKALTITATDRNKTYGELVEFDGDEFTVDGLAFDDAVSSVTLTSDGAAVAADIGDYDIVPTAAEGTGIAHYSIDYVVGTMTVDALPVTVTADPQTKRFGEADPELTFVFEPALIDSDTFAGQLARNAGEELGDYDILQGDLALSANYDLTFESGTLSITKADITGVTFDDASYIYNGTARSLAVGGTLPSGTTVTYADNSRTDVGSQTVTATISGSNYNDLVLQATLTITKANITGVTFTDDSFVYNGTARSLSIGGTLPSGTTVTYADNSLTDVGSQTVTATISGSNYNDLVLQATLTITPSNRSITFPALPTKTYGDNSFAAGASASTGEPISYSSSNPSVATVSTNGQITIHGAGETTIKATVPENNNYADRPEVSRTLTVNKATQTITLTAPTEVNRDAGSIALTVSTSSGLPVTLTLDDPQVATLEGTTLHILRLGTVKITATQSGDSNYEAADPQTITIRVVMESGSGSGSGSGTEIQVRVHPAVSPNGDGINDFLIFEGIKDYPENRVAIFNRNGTIVWEASGYDNGRVAFRGIGTGQQRLPSGTYFYIVEVRNPATGQWTTEKGYFVLRY